MDNMNSGRNWKIAVCILGVLMVAGAVIYSLMMKQSATTAGANAANSNANAIQSANDEKAVTQSNASTAAIDGEPAWVTSLQSKYKTNNFVFVIIPGNDSLTSEARQTVQSAIIKIRQSGTTVDTISINPKDPDLAVTAERLAIQKLPAVLLYNSTGGNTIIKGEISETKLLEAYLSLSKTCEPGSTCAPGKSSCCP